eukprot:TRINITY_DN4224_c0_g1_i3.p1 TRINITY_DN4224_c0_g1~~TRINITY_DN4224_c0_g1_i3.p1  ORF type:complete len:1378 (+),score=276.04 TRINITY_DN4224_c0_g1_i3:306-4439(+)
MRSLKLLDAGSGYKKSYSSSSRGGFSSDRKRDADSPHERSRDGSGYARVSASSSSSRRKHESSHKGGFERSGGSRDADGYSDGSRLRRSSGSFSKRDVYYESSRYGGKGFKSERDRCSRERDRQRDRSDGGRRWKRSRSRDVDDDCYRHRRGRSDANCSSQSRSPSHRSRSKEAGEDMSCKEERSRKVDEISSRCSSSSEMEEGELEPEPENEGTAVPVAVESTDKPSPSVALESTETVSPECKSTLKDSVQLNPSEGERNADLEVEVTQIEGGKDTDIEKKKAEVRDETLEIEHKEPCSAPSKNRDGNDHVKEGLDAQTEGFESPKNQTEELDSPKKDAEDFESQKRDVQDPESQKKDVQDLQSQKTQTEDLETEKKESETDKGLEIVKPCEKESGQYAVVCGLDFSDSAANAKAIIVEKMDQDERSETDKAHENSKFVFNGNVSYEVNVSCEDRNQGGPERTATSPAGASNEHSNDHFGEDTNGMQSDGNEERAHLDPTIDECKTMEVGKETKAENVAALDFNQTSTEQCRDLTLNFTSIASGAAASGSGEKEEGFGDDGKVLPKAISPDKKQIPKDIVKEKGKVLSLSLSSEFWDKKEKLAKEGGVGTCTENKKLKKPKLEDGPLDLSLALPAVSLAPLVIASSVPERSVHSASHTANKTYTRTASDGFTTSMSFSSSHPFAHNPSCSLNQNSVENYEYSVGSHTAFQGNNEQLSNGDWNAVNSNEPASSYDNGNGMVGGSSCQERFKHPREVPLYQKVFQNGNMQSHQVSQTRFSKGQPSTEKGPLLYDNGAIQSAFLVNYSAAKGQQLRGAEGSPGSSSGFEKHIVYPAQPHRDSGGSLGRTHGSDRHVNLPTEQRRELGSSPTQSVGSRDTKFEQRQHIDKEKRKSRERELLVQMGTDHSGSLISLERVLFEIVSEPIPVIAQKLREMSDSLLELLKGCLRELISNGEKGEFPALQAILQRRSDLTSEILSQCHGLQLEILVAIKTGNPDYLQLHTMKTSELIEVLMNLRCRNMTCQSGLPVDDCECKICSQKNGFCSACMCLVCSKFDFASDTCSWVGCDVCLHWCHTDCGIAMKHIKNGPSIHGLPGSTEMHFHCIACEHSSEMFGFVKEVFKTCARGWPADVLAKELDCVRRIFQRSEDMRGKQICIITEQLLAKLENKSSASEVCSSFLAFLAESESKTNAMASMVSKNPSLLKQVDSIDRLPVGVQQSIYKVVPSADDKIGSSDRSHAPSQNYEHELDRRKSDSLDLQFNRSKNRAEIDELESIVRIKHAEAKMFQDRADGARREAEGLRQIAIAKNEKIEEEYACKLAKLCLAETQERRRLKLEELQILERAQHDYYNMKMRMEADIKDLLMKMEAASRQASMRE